MAVVLSPREWYLRPDAKMPWRRAINYDFLESEKKRLAHASEWYHKHYLPAQVGQQLEETPYFVKEVQLAPEYAAEVYSVGSNYECRLLSALPNCEQMTLVMIVDRDNLPPENAFIRVTKSKKHLLFGKGRKAVYAIVVESWEPEEYDKLFILDNFEKNIVAKLFKDTFHDKIIEQSLQAPLMSSPKTGDAVGGIGFVAAVQTSPFSLELHKTIQVMTPPPYRSSFPSKVLLKGARVIVAPGISTTFAERPVLSSKMVKTSLFSSAAYVTQELQRRKQFQGELSVVDSVAPKAKNYDTYQAVLEKFHQSEITTVGIDELADTTYLPPLIKSIDESVWASIVYARQIQPIVQVDDRLKFDIQRRLEQEWEINLAEFGIDEKRIDLMASVRAVQNTKHAFRFAQAQARAHDKREITPEFLEQYLKIFRANLEQFRKHEVVIRAKSQVHEETTSKKQLAIMEFLGSGPMASAELWDELKNKDMFKSLEELQAHLNENEREGLLYKDSLGRYLIAKGY